MFNCILIIAIVEIVFALVFMECDIKLLESLVGFVRVAVFEANISTNVSITISPFKLFLSIISFK